ncbi:piggyBac transposable element-derived protein 4-like [Pecten maximus]|uniref:piggyBac transposable element-derived protein 4-like n=1 Tax=Pecten maximus TaxID=6579 RepID=UPI001458B7FB|nr:piggyBac transposable element-derived protein 4-like [Pecten maximus]
MAVPWIRVFPPEPNRGFGFHDIPRLLHMPPGDSRPLTYFMLLFPETLMKEIIRHTNRYAQNHVRGNQNLIRRHARVRSWKKINLLELKAFLSIFFNMSIIRKPSIPHYWNSTLPSQRSDWFHQTMARNRFQNILKFIQIADYQRRVGREHPAYDPAARFRPLLNFVNRQFLRFIVPRRELCVDESLVSTKGHSVMRQYIPSKAAKYGVKFWLLCESASGYVLQMSVYRGRQFDPTTPGQLQGTNVVHNLLQEASLLGRGYHVFCDSFFTSMHLGHVLLQHHTYVTGTLRKTRPMPLTIRNADPRPGTAVYMRRGNFLCVASRDADHKKPVRLLSTILPAQDLPNGRPKMVMAYNRNMGAVDMDDGLLSVYGKQRKTKKVWKNVFLHIQHRIMLNAYILYRENTTDRPVLSRLQFILQVVESLSGREPTVLPRRARRQRQILVLLPPGKERDCCVCSSHVRHGSGIRRRSRTVCSLCKRGLHRQCQERHNACTEI